MKLAGKLIRAGYALIICGVCMFLVSYAMERGPAPSLTLWEWGAIISAILGIIIAVIGYTLDPSETEE